MATQCREARNGQSGEIFLREMRRRRELPIGPVVIAHRLIRRVRADGRPF
jgi:hypothetical protein